MTQMPSRPANDFIVALCNCWRELSSRRASRWPTMQDALWLNKQARFLHGRVAKFNPTTLQERRDFFRHAMYLLWEFMHFLREYGNRHGPQERLFFAPLFDFKHALMTRMLELSASCPAASWDAGPASDSTGMLSIRFAYSVPGEHNMALRVQWPIDHVPRAVQEMMRQRYRQFPPRTPVPQHPGGDTMPDKPT